MAPRGRSPSAFDAATELFRGPVRAKKQPKGSKPSSGNGGMVNSILRQMSAVSSRSPEAMVRITGGATGRDHVGEHLAYITRNGKLEATNERGETITGRKTVADVEKEWSASRPHRGPDTRNLMLSMPKGTDPEKVLRAAKTFADKTFSGERQYLLALHTDKEHPHVHLTLKRRGFDGKNLNPRKADLEQWRSDFAHELRQLGVRAEATPRRARGVVKKGQSAPVWHITKDNQAGKVDKAGNPRRSRAQLDKYAEAIREVTGQEAPKQRPWERMTAERQAKVRGVWLDTADTLDQHPAPAAQTLAKQIRQFVAEMPPVETERQTMLRQVRSRMERSRQTGPERS